MLLRRLANTARIPCLQVCDYVLGSQTTCSHACQAQQGLPQQAQVLNNQSWEGVQLPTARLSSHAGASTSMAWREARPSSSQLTQSDASDHQHTQPSLVFLRGLKVLRRRFQLPDEVQSAVNRELRVAEFKPPPPAIPPLAPRPLQPTSRRAGCIAYKAGMTQEWDEHGVRVPLTVLWIDDCQVVGWKWPALHGYWALQLGAGYSMQKNLHPGQAGHYLKQGVPLKAVMSEFPVSEDAVLPVGTHITAAHFVAGQSVDVTGWSKNKGFQGVMKRWNFKGMPATHGVSLSHRHGGSIGNRTSPGKVWKGKKMPGQLGDERCTVHDCLVYKVDAARNLVYVRGQVPGPKGQEVLLRDAFNTRHSARLGWQLPHPTYCGKGAAALSDLGRAGLVLALQRKAQPANVPEAQVFRGNKDPYIPYSKETDYFEVRWKKSD